MRRGLKYQQQRQYGDSAEVTQCLGPENHRVYTSQREVHRGIKRRPGGSAIASL
jgi:hypothetical protein